jgi:hypothetical protein
MNTQLVSALIIGAVLRLFIGSSVHKLAGGGVFLRLALMWLVGGTTVAWAVTVLRGKP